MGLGYGVWKARETRHVYSANPAGDEMKTRTFLVTAALSCVALVTACGELPQTTSYSKGAYRGKPDDLPWNSAAFKGDKLAWENALKARHSAQDDFVRMNN